MTATLEGFAMQIVSANAKMGFMEKIAVSLVAFQ